uniref:Uncharacterized protein n=1 Tax=Glossina pallidipes TaxID=7398 RepID=A0A1B0AJ38_GLOPL
MTRGGDGVPPLPDLSLSAPFPDAGCCPSDFVAVFTPCVAAAVAGALPDAGVAGALLGAPVAAALPGGVAGALPDAGVAADLLGDDATAALPAAAAAFAASGSDGGLFLSPSHEVLLSLSPPAGGVCFAQKYLNRLLRDLYNTRPNIVPLQAFYFTLTPTQLDAKSLYFHYHNCLHLSVQQQQQQQQQHIWKEKAKNNRRVLISLQIVNGNSNSNSYGLIVPLQWFASFL